MSDVFLDTNLLIYAVDRAEPTKRDSARKLLRTLRSGSRGVVSTQVLQEFYVVATRKLGVEPSVARRIVHLLEKFRVVTVTVPLVEQAIDCSISAGISFWDALVVVAARSAACDEIWSEDFQRGQVIAGIRVVNPLAVPPR